MERIWKIIIAILIIGYILSKGLNYFNVYQGNKFKQQRMRSTITYAPGLNNAIKLLEKAHKERNSHNYGDACLHYREAIRLLSSNPSPMAKIYLEEAKFSLEILNMQQWGRADFDR